MQAGKDVLARLAFGLVLVLVMSAPASAQTVTGPESRFPQNVLDLLHGRAGLRHGEAGMPHGRAGENGLGSARGEAGQLHGRAGLPHGRNNVPHIRARCPTNARYCE